jgi:PPOX class probable F420-dependent enzyme
MLNLAKLGNSPHFSEVGGRMTTKINVPETHTDLLANPNTAVLTTIGRDGQPQSTAIWYLVDDDGLLKTSITTDRQKYRNLVRNPQATLFVLDPTNPFRTLEIRATVTLSPDPDKALVPKAAERYSTPVELLDEPGSERVVATFDPVRVVAFG